MHGIDQGKNMGGGMHMGGPMQMHGMGACPYCGKSFSAMGGGAYHMGPLSIAKKAKKQLLLEKVKVKLERKHGDELDKMADQIIGFAEDRMRTKTDEMKRYMEMKKIMSDFFSEAEDGGEREKEGSAGE